MAVERFPVEASHILMFARAIGDTNPIYGTDEGVAPPTFVQSSAQFDPDYPLRPKAGERWFGSGGEATGIRREAKEGEGAAAGGLHAEQHYEYHRHPRPGDVLTVTIRPGESWTKEGLRGGRLHFSETVTEYSDQHGELVVTARGVGVRTEKIIEQEGE